MLGALLSGGLLAVATLAPSFVERRAESYLGSRLERDLATRFGLEPAAAHKLAESLPARGKQLVVVRKDAFEREQLFRAGQRSYRLVLDRLLKELRIFGAVQSSLFALGALLVVLGARSRKHVRSTGLGGVIAIATAMTGVVFLCTRDWTWSLVTGDFLGSVYLLMLVLFVAVALDVSINDARLTSMIARVLWWWPP